MLFALFLLSMTSCFLEEEGVLDVVPADGDADVDSVEDSDLDVLDEGDVLPGSCSDGLTNGSETDVDCGGSDCTPCGDGRSCHVGSDCLNGSCTDGTCQPPTCDDGVRNGRENGVDCGGACAPCPHGLACTEQSDCAPWGYCFDGRCDVVGDGRDGPLDLAGGIRIVNQVRSSASGFLGNSVLEVESPEAAGFEPGQRVLVHQTVGPHAGLWEEQIVKNVGTGTLSLQLPLRNSYANSEGSKAQVVVVPRFSTISLTDGALITAPEWDGSTGGILALKANGSITVGAGCAIDMAGRGFRGAATSATPSSSGARGEGTGGAATTSTMPNRNGGGGGGRGDCVVPLMASGGGGGHAATGSTGAFGQECHTAGAAGRAVGGDALQEIHLGGGGGSGAAAASGRGGGGGHGGGLIYLSAVQLVVDGELSVAGEPGCAEVDDSGCGSGGGGGGAGGTVLVKATEVEVELGHLSAPAGPGGDDPDNCGVAGGSGAQGRVFLVADTSSGSNIPVRSAVGACSEAGSCPMSAARCCADLLVDRPTAGDGHYWVDPDLRGPLRAYCDLSSDGGRGYTMIRVEDSALAGTQATYERACGLWGMEIIVPRSRSHALAIQTWNDGVLPNLVNVFPSESSAEGLSAWHGICGGSPCVFWLSNTDDADCEDDIFQPDGDNEPHLRLYRVGPNCEIGEDYGRWNDHDRDTVAIQGWVICSPNE